MRDAASESEKHFLPPKSTFIKRASCQSNHEQPSQRRSSIQSASKRNSYLHNTATKPEQPRRMFTLQTAGSNEANMFQNYESLMSQDPSTVSHPGNRQTFTSTLLGGAQGGTS